MNRHAFMVEVAESEVSTITTVFRPRSQWSSIPLVEGERQEGLTIRQAATLLNVHPNTVRNRIKAGAYKAEKAVTEHGETYLIPRSELERDSPTNNLSTPSPLQEPSQPLADVREAMQAVLAPFINELSDVREELGREKERRERAERRIEELERQLEARESPESAGPTETPTPAPAEPQEATERPQGRSWWRRMFGG
jgi:excisionase family DNA binding protein